MFASMTSLGSSFRADVVESHRVLRQLARALAPPDADVKSVQRAAAELKQTMGDGALVDAIATSALFCAITRVVDSSNHRMVPTPPRVKYTRMAIVGTIVAAAATWWWWWWWSL